MIYDINNNILTDVYDIDDNLLDYAYDIDGNIIYTRGGVYPYLDNRICVFDENFTDNTLNMSRWNYEIGYVRNNEPQHYRPENVIIENNNLILRAIRGHYPGDVTRQSTWTSGSITTANKFEAYYGRWQCRMKLPGLSGSWAGFWMLGGGHDPQYKDDGSNPTNEGPVGYPACGEIDIEESIPGNSNQAHANIWTSSGGGDPKTSNYIDVTEFNIYEMEWTENEVIMMVNGVEYARYDITRTGFDAYIRNGVQYQNGLFMILNQAVNGIGGIVPDGVNQIDIIIDFVRVYAPVGYTQDMIHPTSISLAADATTITVGSSTNISVNFNPVTAFDRTIIWSSSDDSIATVHSGKVKGVAAGQVTITATTHNGITASITITVN